MAYITRLRYSRVTSVLLSPQTRHTEPMLSQFWANVCDAGSTLKQHWFGVSCLLVGYLGLREAGIMATASALPACLHPLHPVIEQHQPTEPATRQSHGTSPSPLCPASIGLTAAPVDPAPHPTPAGDARP